MNKFFAIIVMTSAMASLMVPTLALAAASNPLIKAVKAQDPAAVKKYLQTPAHRARVNAADSHGETALILAAESGNDDILTALLTAKPNLEVEDNAGFTALSYALTNHADSSAMLLISAGARLNHVVTGGKTALMLAAQGGCSESFKKIMSAATEARGTTDALDAAGETALFYAVRSAHFSIALSLVRAGANKDLKNKAGKSVLQTAEDAGLPKEHSLYRALISSAP